MGKAKQRKKYILVSMRVADWPHHGTPAGIEKCYRCGMAVWRSSSSPPHDKAICVQCWTDVAKPDDKIAPPTKEQLADCRSRGMMWLT